MLSGVDFPLKTQDYIHDFFKRHEGTEFIHFADKKFNESIKLRYSIYHLFQNLFGRNKNAIYFLEKLIVKFQQFTHISRKSDIVSCGGSNWFSITDELANYVLSKETLIIKLFRFTSCS